MNLALSLDPCTGLNLAGDHYRPGDFSVSAVVDGYRCEVFADQNVYNTNCFILHTIGGGRDLSINGPVYLDVFVWNGNSFVRGGYLEEIEYTYFFGSTPIRFRALGVRPALYTGGVCIEGLHTKNQFDDFYYGTTGVLNVSVSQPFVFSGRRQNVTNWWADNYRDDDADEPALNAHVNAIVADDVRWNVYRYTRSARSASPASGRSSFRPTP